MMAAVVSACVLCGCGGLAGSSNVSTANRVPASSHVVIVVEENHSYPDVIGSSAMPYLNSLANQYGLATRYFADARPSIPNYFMLTTGHIETLNDAFGGTVTDNNLARILNAAGKSWRVYAEDLPSAGYLGGDTGLYAKRHDPFAFFSDVVNSTSQAANIVPFSQFSADLNGGSLPNLSFVVPNLNDDAHNGTLAQADSWLQTNIAPLLSNAQFQSDGLLIVVFDEGDDLDLQQIGGHVAAVIAGPRVKTGYRSTAFFQHESTLRLMLEALGVSSRPGNAAGAPSMAEFFR